jgi:hypothetical protein
MTEQERAEAFIRKHVGLFFCAACLARELNLTVLIAPTSCGSCEPSRVTR